MRPGIVMLLQDVGGEVMAVQDPLDTAMINGESIPGLDNAREFTRGEGVGKRQADNLLLDMDRYLGFEGSLPTLMRYPAVIQQALEAIPPKPLQIPPEPAYRRGPWRGSAGGGYAALAGWDGGSHTGLRHLDKPGHRLETGRAETKGERLWT